MIETLNFFEALQSRMKKLWTQSYFLIKLVYTGLGTIGLGIMAQFPSNN